MLGNVPAIVAPVFILIGIGYVLARTGVLSQSMGEALGNFVYIVAIPILIFRTLVAADLSTGLPLTLWASYFTGVIVAGTLGYLVIRKGFDRDARAGSIGGISASFANLVMVGLPLISTVYGNEGMVPLLLVVSVHLAIMTIAMAIIMERAAAIDSGGKSPPVLDMMKQAARNLARSPIVIAIVTAFLWRQTGLEIPALLENVLQRIAGTALPIALLSLGMSLVLYGMRGNIVPGLLLSVIKMAIMPAVIFCTSRYLFQLPPLWTAVATLGASCPTGINAYIFANRYGTGHAMSANAITTTTLFAVVTSSLWIMFLDWALGPV